MSDVKPGGNGSGLLLLSLTWVQRFPPLLLTMSNIPANVAPSEIPDGFSLADPTGHAAAGASKQNDAAAQRDAQRQAILEQAMTPDALARLRRVKVGL
jgi:hypothetical protein